MAEDNGWARAFMASSSVSMSDATRTREYPPEWHEARADATPPERLLRLAVHRDHWVREAVAHREDCPLGVLITLAHDRAVDVRVAVAANQRIGRAVAEHLITDRETAVLRALIHNEHVPEDLIDKLAFHRRDTVRLVAAKRIDARPPSTHASTPGLVIVPLPAELRDRSIPQTARLRPL